MGYLEDAAASAARYWLASVFLAGLILCLDVNYKRVSFALLFAGGLLSVWGLILYRGIRYGAGYYLPDCSVPLLHYSQLAIVMVSVLLGYRVFQATRRK